MSFLNPKPKKQEVIKSHDGQLSLPCSIDLSQMDEGSVSELLEKMMSHLGAQMTMSWESVAQAVSTHAPGARLNISLGISCSAHVSLSTNKSPGPNLGHPLQDADQFLAQVVTFTPELFDDALDKIDEAARPKPRRPYAPDWREIDDNGLQHSEQADRYWLKGKSYTEQSARHNGLIGAGQVLREQIKQANDENLGPCP
jgi:hypothetical protein